MCLDMLTKKDEETGSISPGLSSGVESIVASDVSVGVQSGNAYPMHTVILTKFDQRNRPEATVVADGSNTIMYDLYKPSSGRKISEVKSDMNIIRQLFDSQRNIVVNDFMSHVHAFGLDADSVSKNVYDIQLGKLEYDNLRKYAGKMLEYQPRSYEKLIAEATIAYVDLSRHEIFYNYGKENVQWSLDTYTKRSKTLGFNLQGFTDEASIRTPYAGEKDLLVCFDWVAADIRAAAAMSDDSELVGSFLKSDPYTNLQERIGGGLTRNECKLLLLKVINSLDYGDETVRSVYPRLCEWMQEQSERLERSGAANSLLGRRFAISEQRSKLSAFNGVIQGTVAHAMHSCIRRVWDLYPHRLIGEIHDSIIVNCPQQQAELLKMMKEITNIMVRPFDGIIDREIIFPVRISIGKKWKTWQHTYSCRGGKLVREA